MPVLASTLLYRLSSVNSPEREVSKIRLLAPPKKNRLRAEICWFSPMDTPTELLENRLSTPLRASTSLIPIPVSALYTRPARLYVLYSRSHIILMYATQYVSC